jgi:hypothetical protein
MGTNSLTGRYVHEVVRRIPAGQRDDIADELRATIDDTVEARGTADAEREVLTEMGDPIRLAARYADRPPALIGPELYPRYMRLMAILLTTALPLVTALFVVLDVVDDKDLGSAIATALTVATTAAAQMIAWPTVVFALIERDRHRHGKVEGAGTWTPDNLPDDQPGQPDRPDRRGTAAFALAVWDALLIGLIVWQRTARPYHGVHGARLQVLAPQLWSGWIWPILAGLAALVVLNLIRGATREWTVTLAGCSAAAYALFALPLAFILHDRKFFNPVVLRTNFAGHWTVSNAFYTATALIVLVVSGRQVLRRFREAGGTGSTASKPSTHGK